jgi:preprotein translocase subunit YajC
VLLAATQSGSSSTFTTLLMFVLIIGAMYMLVIRPAQRRRKDVEKLQNTLGVGAEVVTVGGLYGTVVEIDGDTVDLEVAPGIVNRYARAAVGKVVTPATVTEPDTTPEASTDTTGGETVPRD